MSMTASAVRGGRVDVDVSAAPPHKQSAGQGRWLSWFPWLLVPLAAAAARGPLDDPDLGWHLRAGQLVIDRHSLPTRDTWSFASTRPWVLHEWLSEVVMAAANSVAGLAGITFLRMALFALLATAVVRSVSHVAPPALTCLVAVLALVGTVSGASERPQLLSFVLMAWWGPRLLGAAASVRPPWELVPLTWFWACVHGFWSLGVLLFLAVSAGLFLDVGRRDLRRWWRFARVGLAALVAAALTPTGPAVLLSPFVVTGYAHFVSEWQAPSLLWPPALAAATLLVVVVLGWARTGRRVDYHVMAYVVTAASGFVYMRTVPVVSVLLAPLAAAALTQLLRGPDAGPVGRQPRRWLAASAAGLATAAVVAALSPAPTYGAGQTGGALRRLPSGTHVLNEYDSGGRLLFDVPTVSPAIDGRAEIYDADYVERYLDALRLQGDWQGMVRDAQPQAAWLRRKTPLVVGLRDVLGWQTVADDGDMVVLVPAASAGQPR